jgi:hypothetical protein
MKIRIVSLILALGALVPALVFAAVPNTPLHWAKESFNDDGQAVEHVTIRGRNATDQGLFARFSIANAGFKHGELTVTFRQEAPGGTYYGEQKFSRDNYSVAADRLSIKAGGHSLEVQNGHLVATFAFESVKATVDVAPQVAAMTVADRRGDYIVRDILAPMAKIAVHAQDGVRLFDTSVAGFAVHEASNATAYKVYDRAIQLHNMGGGTFVVVDYIDLPAERGGRTLGFAAISQKGVTFVGEVVKESRENEHPDSEFGYQVPWSVTVLAKHGEARAAIRMTAEKQLSKEDDLKDLGFLARKAVGTLMHPVTYALKGQATGEVQLTVAQPAQALEPFAMRYKYAQVR